MDINLAKMSGLLIPLFALAIPIVAILSAHQQKMAQLYRQGHEADSQTVAEMNQLREELRQLRESMSGLIFKIEDLESKSRTSMEGQDLQNRIQ